MHKKSGQKLTTQLIYLHPAEIRWVFLVAADNIEQIDGAVENEAEAEKALPAAFTRYRFDINGPRYAEHMRRQMQAQMSQNGELPPGMTLDVSQHYVEMTGWGEIWLDEAGLPARQVIHLEFPPQKDALDWYEANITTTFSNWDTKGIENQLVWAIPRLLDDPSLITQEPLSLLPTSFDPATVQQAVTFLGFSLLLCGLAFLAFTYRRSPKLYGAIVSLVIVSMLFSPLLQVSQAQAFYDSHEAEQSDQEQQIDVAQPATQDEAVFNPTVNPLASQSAQQNNLEGANQNLPQYSTDCASAMDANNDGVAEGFNDDTDGDGLTDGVECTQLGTFLDDVDSDGDGISDQTEVVGFYANGRTWYLDPLNFDSNGDGISDMIECSTLVDVAADGTLTTPTGSTCVDTDSDGVPDLFDFDNDGDGVPDSVDTAPTYRGDLTLNPHDSFNLSLSDYDTANAGALVVEFELRPTTYEHLFQNQ